MKIEQICDGSLLFFLLRHKELPRVHGRYKLKTEYAHPVWAEIRLQTKSYMYTCVHVSGNMLKFIRQKSGAECERSEEFGEVDRRH